jgi:hypothetical protein
MVVDDADARAALYRMTTSVIAATAKMRCGATNPNGSLADEAKFDASPVCTSPRMLLIAHRFDAVVESM